jgi:4-amino-4-deoxy-L-arabinose transferase-like glycosyltransferase
MAVATAPDTAPDAAPPPPRAGGDARLLWGLAALLLLLHAALAWAVRVPSITTGNDDAVYLLLARALREGGYHDAYYVGAPIHSQYPPLFPALLAVIGAAVGERLGVMVAANILLSAGGLALTFAAARRLAPWPALAALACLAVNPTLVDAAATISSEPLLTFLAALALWLLARQRPSSGARAGAGAAAIGGALARSAGVPLVAAVGLHWLLERRWRDALLLGVAAALTVGAWLAWTVVAPGKVVGRSYIADARHDPGSRAASPAPAPLPLEALDALRQVSAEPARAPLPAGEPEEADSTAATPPPTRAQGMAEVLARRVASTVPTYLSQSLPSALALPTVAGTIADNLLWLASILLFGGVGGWILWRRWRAAALFVLLTAILLALWPYVRPRFLVPILPSILVAVMLGAAAAGARLHRRLALLLPFVLALPVVAGGAARDAERVRRAQGCDRAAPLVSPGCFDASQRAFFEATAYIARELPADAVVLTAKEGTFHYLTGRRATQLLGAVGMDAPTLREHLRATGTTHVLLSRLREDEWQVGGALLRLCPELTLVRAWSPVTVLLRVEAPPPGERRAACVAIARYAMTG